MLIEFYKYFLKEKGRGRRGTVGSLLINTLGNKKT